VTLFLFKEGPLNLDLLIPMCTGALFSVPFSVFAINQTKEEYLTIVIAIITMVMGALTIWKAMKNQLIPKQTRSLSVRAGGEDSCGIAVAQSFTNTARKAHADPPPLSDLKTVVAVARYTSLVLSLRSASEPVPARQASFSAQADKQAHINTQQKGCRHNGSRIFFKIGSYD